MAIITEKSGGQVRLRGVKYSLPVNLDIGSRRIRLSLEPNKWMKVPSEVYTMLKSKFDCPKYSMALDVEENERNPHKPGEEPATKQVEREQDFILEFRS